MNNNTNFNNMQFDPTTEQPINQQSQLQPIQNQRTTNMYSQSQQPVQSNMNTYQQPVQFPQPKKKVNIKMLIIISVIVVAVIVGIIFVSKLLSNKESNTIINDNEQIIDISAYKYSEIVDEINIFKNQYSFKANDKVELFMIDEDWDVTLNGKSDSKEYYVNVRIYDSFEDIVNYNIYDDTQRENVNYEINKENEVLFSSLNSDNNVDIVAYGYKLDNQILGFVVSRSNNVERLEISLEDAKTIIYNCKETISTDKGYKSSQDKIMEYAIFGNYMIKDEKMIKTIYKDGFYLTREYTDEKTNKFIYTSIGVSFNDTDYGLFDFEGEITEEKEFEGFHLLWNDFGDEALVIMSKQNYKYYLNIKRNIEYVAKTPSIEESYRIFNSFFEKKVRNKE
jgi:hypothetical protein